MSELVELQRRSSLVWDDYRADLLAHPEVIEVPVDALATGRVRVAERDGAIAGFATLLPCAPGVEELDGLFVEPDLMRAGIGRVLVEDAVTVALARGVTRLEVTANPRALGFYERVGFVADHEVPTQFGPAIRMHRDLDPTD
jgi:GNAT superfamily N-acetyltransferase